LKEHFATVDSQEVLAQVAGLPITTWNYKAEDPGVRHMGPVAQDFYATFGLGLDDRHIAPADAAGVALVAIQGLYAQDQELAAENAALKSENTAQQAQLNDMKARLAALEAAVGTRQASDLQIPGGWLALGGLVVVGAAAGRRRLFGGGQ
jgi:hypothetical protein